MATINGTSSDDTLQGGAQADLINGGGGDDFLIGGDGDDTLNGGSGTNDIAGYLSASGSVTVNLAAGTATGAAGNDTLISIEFAFGSNFIDTLTGDNDSNFLRGYLGDDVLDGGGQGIALARGNFQGDFADYRNSNGPVTVSLVTGTATGAAGNDTLVNCESIRGSDYGDTLVGNSGDNFLRGGMGDDTLQGGGGSKDFADYRNAFDGITANLATHTSSGPDGVDTLSGIEGLSGSDLDDTLIGNGGDNWFRGRTGDDTMNGGGGFDMVTYRPASGSVIVSLQNGSAAGVEDNDTLSRIEGVEGTMYNDTLIGSNGTDNALYGFGGDDRLSGGGGKDTVVGGAGNDVLIGGAGNDALVGDSGNDTLVYHQYDTRVRGGDGTDTLRLVGGDVTLDLTAIDNDIITGIEKINIAGSGNNTLDIAVDDLLDLSNTTNQLTVDGNGGDTVNLDGTWTDDGAGATYHTYTSGAATILIDNDIFVT